MKYRPDSPCAPKGCFEDVPGAFARCANKCEHDACLALECEPPTAGVPIAGSQPVGQPVLIAEGEAVPEEELPLAPKSYKDAERGIKYRRAGKEGVWVRSTKRWERGCSVGGCNKGAEGSTDKCSRHGGGRRCSVGGCTKSARGGTDKCNRHGGGRRCSVGGCTKSARGGTDKCKGHGGGRRCSVGGCTKSAREGTDKCKGHGGGRRCSVGGCTKSAEGSTDKCIVHGGGRRCGVEHCVPDDATGVTPYAKYELPDGTPACLGCMLRLQPGNKQLRSCVSKEQFLAIANELEFPELEAESLERPECDATIGTGQSKRRIDRAWTPLHPVQRKRFKLANECDEGGACGHQSNQGCYSQDGQSGKWSGHMSDLGAPAISERDANWLDQQTLAADEAAGSSTHKVKKMERILEAVTEQKAAMMPFRVVSLQVDEYVDCYGKTHGSAFYQYRVRGDRETSGEKRLRTVADEFDHRYRCNARELRRCIAMGAEGPSFVHVRLFYDGCDPATGLQPAELAVRLAESRAKAWEDESDSE